jgi:hypothetical protein
MIPEYQNYSDASAEEVETSKEIWDVLFQL